MPKQVVNEAKDKMEKALQTLKKELGTLRAGRANPSLLEKITVDYYGSPTPINQVASISVPEPRLLVLQPWDKSILHNIEKAIQKSDLGLSPTNDGTVIRIPIPPLTEERRVELTKLVKKYGEEAKVAIRNIRRDANESFKKMEKEGQISEDENRRYQEQVQELTDHYAKRVDETVKQKENEIMEI
ncbi:ribosome recycling factor [Thermicanus aegyptius]|uniref:ribosome recycling factor n=1 Tax=Thermicanus aegyptius TaxID=94009 RepID=UPI00041049A8|nr:ribosome recycling factor [Thermicanus aegyptius]